MPTTEGTCNRGLAYTNQAPDLTPMPPRPARTQPKPSTAPASWGPRPRYREPGDQAVGAAFNRRRKTDQTRQAFT